MDARKRVWLVVVASVALVALTGCPTLGGRTNNQGGGSLISAGLKISQDNLDALTADEIQIAADFLINQQNLPIPPLSDDQAAAVVQFMADNNIQTKADFEALKDKSLDEIVISDQVLAVLESQEVLDIVESLTGADLSSVDLSGRGS
jgi:hypothetical protein